LQKTGISKLAELVTKLLEPQPCKMKF